MAKKVVLSNGLPAIEVKPFSDTREGVASLLTVSMMETHDTYHCDAEFIRADGHLIGIRVMFWNCDCTTQDVLDFLYRIERLLNNKAIIMLSSVFRLASRKLSCNYSIYSISPDFQWGGLQPDERL